MSNPTLQELSQTLEELRLLAECALEECRHAEQNWAESHHLQGRVSQIAITAEALALRIHQAEAAPPPPPDDQEESGRRRQSTEDSVRLAFSSV